MSELDSLRKMDDEALLNLYRKGKKAARDVLSVRYFNIRNSLWEVVMPNVQNHINVWEMNECFFFAYLKAESGFDFERDVKFLSYFCSILRIEAVKTIKIYYHDLAHNTAKSLDDKPDGEEPDVLEYHEVITAWGREDPRVYANFEEILKEADNTPVSNNTPVKTLFFLANNGFKPRDIAVITGKSESSIRRNYRKIKGHLRAWVEKQEKLIETLDSKELEAEALSNPSDKDD